MWHRRSISRYLLSSERKSGQETTQRLYYFKLKENYVTIGRGLKSECSANYFWFPAKHGRERKSTKNCNVLNCHLDASDLVGIQVFDLEVTTTLLLIFFILSFSFKHWNICSSVSHGPSLGI